LRPQVRNDGIIAAKLGKVALASTESFKLDVYGDDLIAFTTSEQVVDTLHTVDGVPLGVDNAGTIKAEGGTVLLTARQLDGVVSSVVNNSGLVSAASAEMAGGKIVFKGEGAQVGVSNTGVVDASSEKSDGGSVRVTADGKASSSGTVAATGGTKGGSVVLTGNEVELAGKGLVDASGQQGGGTVLIGGNPQCQGPEQNAAKTTVGADVVIRADAVSSGNGGQVVVWSDNSTVFDGTISARGGATGGDGGWVETSGQVLKVGDSARVDTSATKGKFGTWLLDPADFVIGPVGGIQNIDTGELIVSDMTGETLSANLGNNNVTIQSSQGQSGTNGDISIYDDVIWSSNTILTLSAYRNVNINANITATGDTAGLNIAPATGDSTGVFNLTSWATVTLSGANPSLSIFGQPFTVINSIEALQNMNQNLAGYYALGSDIDASVTSGWNGGEGFEPIGTNGAGFTGVFHGLGHIIADLTIERYYTSGVGLFGFNYGLVYNVGIVEAVIAGFDMVGALVGFNGGTIFNSYSTVTVGGVNGNIGGLVGMNSRGTITNSYSIVSASFSSNITAVTIEDEVSIVGGLVGENYFGTISNSYSIGTIAGDYSETFGGFVGDNSGTISNSYSTTTVNGYVESVCFGGFAGRNSGTISNSYSTGSVTPFISGAGGFVGNNSGTISNSYSTGKVIGGGSATGGFVGDNSGTISNSYSMGTVTGWNFTGGFAGSNSGAISNSYSIGAVVSDMFGGSVGGFTGLWYDTAATTNSYWDTQASGLTNGIGTTVGTSENPVILTGLTTAQMMAMLSFNGWDFTNTWSIDEGHDYPKLRHAGLSGSSFAMTDPGPAASTGGDTPGGGTTDPGTGGSTGDETGGGTGTGGTGGDTPSGGTDNPYPNGYFLPLNPQDSIDKDAGTSGTLPPVYSQEWITYFNTVIQGFHGTASSIDTANEAMSSALIAIYDLETTEKMVGSLAGAITTAIATGDITKIISCAEILTDPDLVYGAVSMVMAQSYIDKSNDEIIKFYEIYNSGKIEDKDELIQALTHLKYAAEYSEAAYSICGDTIKKYNDWSNGPTVLGLNIGLTLDIEKNIFSSAIGGVLSSTGVTDIQQLVLKTATGGGDVIDSIKTLMDEVETGRGVVPAMVHCVVLSMMI